MELEYHLMGSKDLNKEEKKEKKKEHETAYYRFINRFKTHLKKIENNFTGDDLTPLKNHFNFINKCENELEEQRENCLNCYKALKEQINLIENYIPNFDINVFNTFFQSFEEYYSFFQKTKEILETFSKYNDDTQNLYYICKRKNFCIEALKEFVDKISEEYADKIEQYELLNKKFQELTESYDKLYKIYSESKNSDINNKLGNNENKDLIISKLNHKIQDLSIENDRINKKYLECSRELERLNMHLKINFVLKSESENIVNEYKYKLKHFENESIRIKEEIKSLRKENEKLIEQKEYFENQINTELNNINHDGNNNENNLENILNNNNLIEENRNEEEELESSKNLENLIMNCEEVETEEAPDEKNEEKIEINNNKDIKIEKISINNNDIKTEKISINRNNIKDDKIKNLENRISENINNAPYSKSKSVRFKQEFNSKDIINTKKSVNFNDYKKKKSDNINNAYNIMFKGRQFQYPTRIASKDYHDYFKQFFFLLFQSMKMNSDKDIEIYLGYNPEVLYKECKNEHIPFHKYQKWIEKKLTKNNKNINSKKYEDFATITGILCSSFI